MSRDTLRARTHSRAPPLCITLQPRYTRLAAAIWRLESENDRFSRPMRGGKGGIVFTEATVRFHLGQ